MTWREKLRPIVQAVIREHCGAFGRIDPPEERLVRKALFTEWDRRGLGVRANQPYRIWLDEISKQLAGRTGRATEQRPRKVAVRAELQPDPRQMVMFEEGV
jgi:hypothetical protein